MDPAAHVAELAVGLDLEGNGVGLFTAARVSDLAQCEDEGAHPAATVGLRVPTWAAVPSDNADREPALAWRPGTINFLVSVSVPLSEAAYVNAVITATEEDPGSARRGIPRQWHGLGRHLCRRPGGGRTRGLRRTAVAVGRAGRPHGALCRARWRGTLPGAGIPGTGMAPPGSIPPG